MVSRSRTSRRSRVVAEASSTGPRTEVMIMAMMRRREAEGREGLEMTEAEAEAIEVEEEAEVGEAIEKTNLASQRHASTAVMTVIWREIARSLASREMRNQETTTNQKVREDRDRRRMTQ